MTRDLTHAAFVAALARHGFVPTLVGVRINRNHTIGFILSKRHGEWKLDRRATLARAVRASRER